LKEILEPIGNQRGTESSAKLHGHLCHLFSYWLHCIAPVYIYYQYYYISFR